jgi:cellulose biosynthesis protein BcsQ
MPFRFDERNVTKSAPGKVVAFYSYKGGTGRTMALANVGCTLAQDQNSKRPVLLVDWDLEAPGLHRYFRKQVTAAFQSEELFAKAPGLIDLFVKLQSHIATNGDHSRPDQDLGAVTKLLNDFPLQTYITKTDIPRLHLLKAGCFDDDYAAKIGSFRWPELYRRSPHLLKAFADRLASEYSFVIIDSRTGLTDTSGICAMLMPEILVAVFTPNRQSLFGVIDLVREAARYRAGSDDLRPLMVYPLPSRIEASEPALRQSWRFGDSSSGVPGFQGMFEQTFKEIYELPACDLGNYFDDVQIQHLPSYAYGEEIAVLVEEARDRLSLTQSYLRFTARLTKGEAPWAPTTSMEEAVNDPILERRLRQNERHVLKLTVEDNGTGCRVVAEFNGMERKVDVGMLPGHFRKNLASLQAAIHESPGARSAQPSQRSPSDAMARTTDDMIVREVGSQLFDFIFQRSVLDLYRECYARARKVGQPLLIRLRVTHPGLSYVPWETLYDRTNRFYIAVSQQTLLTRALEDKDDDIATGGGRPIRVLAMTAHAKVLHGIALDLIDVDAEQMAMTKALGDINDGKRIKLSWTVSAQTRELNRRFIRGDAGKPWDIFHFIGHGGHDPTRKMGFIVVQEEGGSKGIMLYSDDLRSIICQPGKTPGLVVLSSCIGARSEPGMLFSSVAEELIRGGVPAVIAMQFEISDNMAVAFSDAFYTYLADNFSIQSALAHTRAELKLREFGEWIAPVLYMRGLNGEIFIDIGAA